MANSISVTEEYLNYHDKYVKKFGKDRTLVLMQVGSFYEAYSTKDKGPDLKKLEELTEATIAHKGKDKSKIDINNPLMWGFPMVASLKFIGILIENGYRLIMIDQVTPKPNIKREVVAIHSPATYHETSYKPTSNFVAVICIEEIPQKNNTVLSCVGMSAIDVSTGEVYLHESHSKLTDDKLGLDETIRFLNSLVPKETIIYKENLVKLSDEYIIEYLDLEGKFYQIRDINKDHLKINYQKKILEKVYPERENMTSIIDTLGLSNTIYARKSLVNLLTYVSDHYDALVKNVSDPIFYLQDEHLVLGNDAINQLNIVDNKSSQEIPGSIKYHNLLDVINKANTGMGKRYVKMCLISPFTDPKKLNYIYDTVNLLSQKDQFTNIDKILKQVHDIERLYRKLSIGVLQPMQLVDLIHSCLTTKELIDTLKQNKKVFDYFKNEFKLNDLLTLNNKLNNEFNKMIDEDKARMYNLADIRENIFKEGIYPDLDDLQSKLGVNHELMELLLDELDKMIVDQNSKTKKVVLKHNKRDGYYYQITSKRYKSLQKTFNEVKEIKINNKKILVKDFEVTEINNNVKLSLPFLKNQTADIDDLIEQIMNLTFNYYKKFMGRLDIEYSDYFKRMIDFVTKIDYYVTISKVAKEYNYVRPIIDDKQNSNGYISAKDIRHPIVERIIEHEYVPHSINIGSDMKGMLIYGLNSAGKSVLMKAIGISVIMAQAGFFVPASEYKYYPYKSLYTRITGNDNLFRGLSSFSLEIVELNAILKRSNQSTLVIGDEVCRGTEHISGNAIVASSLLKLSELNASFVFATHLHELMELDEINNNNKIKAFHLSVEHDEKTDKLIYDRELKPGSGERIYGITVAKYIIKDNDFINKAFEIKNRLLNKDPKSSVISTKKSRYNSDLLVDECSICKKKCNTELETHHINFQKDCENGFVKNKPHIQKNQLFNLVVLCDQCHDKIHNDNIKIDSIKMTSRGKQVIVKNKSK